MSAEVEVDLGGDGEMDGVKKTGTECMHFLSN